MTMREPTRQPKSQTVELRFGARDRILDAAYRLFSVRGIRDVGIDEVIQRSGVAKATLYRHFPSKTDLALAFLQLREERWTSNLLTAGARSRGKTAEEQLLALFDVLDDWFRQEDFDTCAFINVLLEMRADHPLGMASIGHLDTIRGVVAQFAAGAGLARTDEFARSWHLLMKGAVVSAAEGDLDAALRAKEMAVDLVARHRPAEA
ncbi:TetR/AcrR family transcriptional regulator [Yinghuangia soli]|uniref:TetR/AcrR family transcriptional regulator n=1 Tax=Yinghuangia soli TaxID=2908204 RepID=A0AA41Q3Y7_9ACTN|nr:TetR/AcrR family transcriptional regulator [Yinghuangia soli]MCF2530271.1 TetR/AcrR family transcriptional regulator [Yinghuangia soli]